MSLSVSSALDYSSESNYFPDDPGFETFMWYMYKNNKFKDSFDVFFVLKTKDGERVFSAHKMMLSIWSPEFEDMFYKREKLDNRVDIEGVNPDAFEDMIKFVYCWEPDIDSHEKACELLKVATKFKITYLITLCQNFLSSLKIDVTNVFDVLEIAESIQDQHLVSRCMEIVQNETKSIILHYDCSDVTPSMVQVILDSPKLALESEFELLVWIFAWAKNRMLDNSLFSIREVLGEFLPQLHFLELTSIEFATICKHHEEFFSGKEAFSIFMNLAIRDSCPMPVWYDVKATRRQFILQDH